MRKTNKIILTFVKAFLIITVIAAVCLMGGHHNVYAANSEGYRINGLWWGFEKATGTITWIPYEWEGGAIPEEIEGVKVVALSDDWVCTNSNGKRDHVKEIILPQGLKRIGKGAFYKCNIESIVIPDSVEVIAGQAFSGCASLKELLIPDSVKEFDASAINGCTSLEKLVLSGGITEIDEGCFCNMEKIRSITIPGSVKKIGNYCFRNDPLLEEIILEDGASGRSIGEYCAIDLPSLKKIYIGKGFEVIGPGMGRSSATLEVLSLPSGLKSIGDYAFRFDENLEQVTVGGKEIDYWFQFEELGIKLGDYAFGDTYFLRKDFSPSYKTGKWYEALHKLELNAGETGDYVSDIFKIAYSQYDYHEGNSFDEQHGNNTKGNKDFAEYNYWWGEPGTKWCGEFAGWVIAMASVPEEIYSSKYDTPDEDTYEWKDTAYAGGKYKIKKGDVILFYYDGGNHVIMVESVSTSGNTVTINSIDGNHGNNVQNDVYKINAKNGKTTNCWVDDNGYVAKVYGPDWSKVKDVKYYTVKFDANGGKTETKSKKLSNGAFYGVLPIPTYSGYDFDGWYTEKDGGKKITAYRKVNLEGNTTLYAHWTKNGDSGSGKDEGNDSKKSDVKISASKSKVKYSKVKKKAISVTINVKGSVSEVKYENATSAALKDYVSVSDKGKVTFAKGAKKGTYKIKVTVIGTDGSKTAKTLKIKVK